MNIFYVTSYYYFLPFLVNWVPYLAPGSAKDGKYKKMAKYAALAQLAEEGYSPSLK